MVHVLDVLLRHHAEDHARDIPRPRGADDVLLQDVVRVAMGVEAALLAGQESLGHDRAVPGRPAGHAKLVGDARHAQVARRCGGLDRGGVLLGRFGACQYLVGNGGGGGFSVKCDLFHCQLSMQDSRKIREGNQSCFFVALPQLQPQRG